MNDFEQEQLLIDLIQHFPFLFDKSSKDFKDNNKKNNAWETLATALSSTVEDTQKMWKLLRERFAKERKKLTNLPSGSEAPELTWPLYKYMLFMEKHIASRKRVSNVSRPPSEASFSNYILTPLTSPVRDNEEVLCEREEINEIESQGQKRDMVEALSEEESVVKRTRANPEKSLLTPQAITSGAQKRGRQQKSADTVEETLGVLTTYLQDKQKPNKNMAFGQYVGFTLSEMSNQEANYKKLRIVEILNSDFP